jgi:hypothetical protein
MNARVLVSAGLLAAGLMAGCGGCKKAAPAIQPAPAPVAQVEPPRPPEPPQVADAGGVEAPEPPDDAKVVVDEALVGRYLAYLKVPRTTPAAGAGERLAEDRRLASSSGLRWAEVEAMRQLMIDVVESRRLFEQMGGEQEMEKVREKLAALKPEKRAELEPQIKAAQANQLKMRDVPEARAKWGDAAVDAVIKREKELGEAWDAAKK